MLCISHPLNVNYNSFSYFTKEGYWAPETAKNIPDQQRADKNLKTITLFFIHPLGIL